MNTRTLAVAMQVNKKLQDLEIQPLNMKTITTDKAQ